MSTVNDKTLRKYSSDLLSLQHHLLKAVKKQQVSEKVKQKEAIEILHLLNLKLSEIAEEFEPMVAEFGENRKEEVKSKIGKKAVKNTQKAWSSENIKAGPEVIEI